MEPLVSLASGLVGVLFGALLSAWLGGRRDRMDRVFEMHSEFEDPAMIQTRYRASELLAQNAGESVSQLRGRLGRAALSDVWAVTGFYQRLWLAVRLHAVAEKLVPDLFGSTFIWWCESSFRHQVMVDPGERSAHLRDFEQWMIHHVSPQTLAEWRSGNVASPFSTSAPAGDADPAR